MIEAQIVNAENYPQTMLAVPPSHYNHLPHVIFRLPLHNTNVLIYIYTERQRHNPTPIQGVDNQKWWDSWRPETMSLLEIRKHHKISFKNRGCALNLVIWWNARYERALYTFERALYTLQRAEYTLKRALHKRALYTAKTAVDTLESLSYTRALYTPSSSQWGRHILRISYQWVMSPTSRSHVSRRVSSRVPVRVIAAELPRVTHGLRIWYYK